MDREQKPAETQSSKFGKLLAVGMAVALIWGLIILVFAIYLQSKLGTLITYMMGDYSSLVVKENVMNTHSQNILPLSETIGDDVDFGDWHNALTYLIMALAILTILFACLGIYGGLNHNRISLYVTIVLLLITGLIILLLLNISADNEATFHKDARKALINKLQSTYAIETVDNMFILAMNAIMLWFECCGINGPSDFHNLTFNEGFGSGQIDKVEFKVPPACCSREILKQKETEMNTYTLIKECAMKGSTIVGGLNSKGCYDEVFNKLCTPAIGILVLILIWNLLVLLLTILTIVEIKPEEEGAAMARGEMKDETVEAPAMKKFVPFAKISSYVSQDVNRIKSTEIW